MIAAVSLLNKVKYHVVLLFCVISILYYCWYFHQDPLSDTLPIGLPENQRQYDSPPNNKFEDLTLTRNDCLATFPGLFDVIDSSVAEGLFDLKRDSNDHVGRLHGRIKDGKVIFYHILVCVNIIMLSFPTDLYHFKGV
jgi:hypothetical protein